jgi:glutamate N-acetyltransferase / amino-acid N-acetyltransferase
VAVSPVPALGTRTGVCAPAGFRAGAAACGIRGDDDAQRLDLAVVVSDLPGSAAGVFTQSLVKAAPVVISQLAIRRGRAVSAVVINAGNANACTGPQGFRDALVTCAAAADLLDLDPSAVLVCSTGVIGRPMPMDAVRSGVHAAVRALELDGDPAAQAILTTDTRAKTATATCGVHGLTCTVGGMAKGAGMVHPNLATLLAVLTTDACVAAPVLQRLLARVADDTFNCVTVDGDTSTNDSLLLIANGAAGGPRLEEGSAGLASLEAAVHEVCESLSEQVVADAEGASRHFRVSVRGAVDDAQAKLAAMAVAGSPLVKTAVHGGDPNWGRVIAALGRSGASFTLDACAVAIGGVTVFANGAPAECDLTAVRAALLRPRSDIDIELGTGAGTGHAWGCELSAGYVRINADYTT